MRHIVVWPRSRSASVSCCAYLGSWHGEGLWLLLLALVTCDRCQVTPASSTRDFFHTDRKLQTLWNMVINCQNFITFAKNVRDCLSFSHSTVHWFKSYSNFAELVDFAYWFSCIVRCLRLKPAMNGNTISTQSSFAAPLVSKILYYLYFLAPESYYT